MQPIKDIRASGNAEVEALFLRWAEKAKQGRLRYAAIVACENQGHVDVEHAGSAGCEFAANFGFDLLKDNIFGHKRSGGADGLGPDFVRYDLSRAPVGWDFASWLIDQEMGRIRANAPGPLKVAFIGDVGKRKWGPTEARMVENVMRPLLGLIGAVEDPRAAHSAVIKEFYMLRYVTEAAAHGEKVPMFKPPAEWANRTSPGHVTITLREAEHWPHRNSNMTAWTKLAQELRRRGETVIIVRDTAHATEPFEDFLICPEASTDIGARAALYASAKCNLFVANGPWSLALFGDRPWLMFNAVSTADPFDANQPEMWKDFHGIGQGEQFPWSRLEQRIIWHADDYETMLAAWNQLEPLLERAQAA